jgi:DNA mismatch repair protein MutL
VATIKERSPEVHLFLEVPPDRVDVNVHPTKAEVRFLEQSLVHELLRRAIGDALGQSRAPELELHLVQPRAASPGPDESPALPGILGSQLATGQRTAGAPAGHIADTIATQSTLSAKSHDIDVPPFAGIDPTVYAGLGAAGAMQSMPVDAVRPMIPLGQFRDTYILAVDEEGIAIVDQHVAHERVLFEQVLERLAEGRLPGQRLLTPMLVDLPPAQRESIAAHRDDLDRLGFEVEDFGGGSLRVSAIPAVLGAEQAAQAIRALGEDLEGLDRGARVVDAVRRIAATTACHAAVRANQRLTREKMIYILDELRRTSYSSICPHGRPVVLRLTRREIERNFQRI